MGLVPRNDAILARLLQSSHSYGSNPNTRERKVKYTLPIMALLLKSVAVSGAVHMETPVQLGSAAGVTGALQVS